MCIKASCYSTYEENVSLREKLTLLLQIKLFPHLDKFFFYRWYAQKLNFFCVLRNILNLNNGLWWYRYLHYSTNQHRIGTDNYRYSNGQRFCVYWFIRGDKQIYIQDR